MFGTLLISEMKSTGNAFLQSERWAGGAAGNDDVVATECYCGGAFKVFGGGRVGRFCLRCYNALHDYGCEKFRRPGLVNTRFKFEWMLRRVRKKFSSATEGQQIKLAHQLAMYRDCFHLKESYGDEVFRAYLGRRYHRFSAMAGRALNLEGAQELGHNVQNNYLKYHRMFRWIGFPS